MACDGQFAQDGVFDGEEETAGAGVDGACLAHGEPAIEAAGEVLRFFGVGSVGVEEGEEVDVVEEEFELVGKERGRRVSARRAKRPARRAVAPSRQVDGRFTLKNRCFGAPGVARCP